MTYKLIVAVDSMDGIGKNGVIPWNIPVDIKHFKDYTSGQIIIMGRKTWDSLVNKPLPNRLNVIISKTLKQSDITQYENTIVFNSYESCIHSLNSRKEDKIVIGGADIYLMFRNLIDEMSITYIDKHYYCDVFMSFDTKDFKCVSNTVYSDFKIQIWKYVNREEMKMLDLTRSILKHGDYRMDRTGVGTKSLFSPNQLRFDLTNNNFPMATTRKLPLRHIFEELMWFSRGQSDVSILNQKGITVWDKNTTQEFINEQKLEISLKSKDLGVSYGFNMRHFGAQYQDCHTDYTGQGFDQLSDIITALKNKSSSRRLIISLWNPAEMKKTALPPCMYLYQFYVDSQGQLSCKASQRSSDTLAIHWNIATASLLTILLANFCGLQVKELIWSPADTHVYMNHLEGVKEWISRTPQRYPKLYITGSPKEFDQYTFENLQLIDYNPQSSIKMEMNA